MMLVQNMLAGHRLSLARVISKVENRDGDLSRMIEEIFSLTGRAQIWGITGPPGSGKSTLVDQITVSLRQKQKKVAILAVDPSSPFTGGAILGDRIRMQRHFSDPGVYIRSLGTRGCHGGLSHATKEVVWVLDAAGFDVVLVETAGVGQTELEVLKVAESILVVLVPESGDSIQVMKAGLMEIADVFAVNKNDRPEADKLRKELITMIELGGHSDASPALWGIPVCMTQANQNLGVEELVTSMLSHQEYLRQTGKKDLKHRESLKQEVVSILTEKLSAVYLERLKTPLGIQILDDLAIRKIDPYRAADLLSEMNT